MWPPSGRERKFPLNNHTERLVVGSKAQPGELVSTDLIRKTALVARSPFIPRAGYDFYGISRGQQAFCFERQDRPTHKEIWWVVSLISRVTTAADALKSGAGDDMWGVLFDGDSKEIVCCTGLVSG